MTIDIHTTARVSHLADLEPSTRGTVYSIGAGSVVDSFVKFKPAGGTGNITLGERSILNSGCVLYSGHGITIGNDVLVAANCVFAPVNHAYADKNRRINEQRFLPSKGGIIIEDDVWIGAGCTILDGTILRRGCVIGAMSLVRGEIPAYTVWGGMPMRKLGERT